MHGIIFKELQRYVSKKFDLPTWYALLKSVDLDKKIYMPTENYPDEEINALVSAASTVADRPVNFILEDFGEFLAPNLMQVYRTMIPLQWRTLDLLERTESTIHKAVRFVDQVTTPPRLVCTRTSSQEVVIDYSSQRKMSSLGVGIIRGIAKHYGENVLINVTHCSDSKCQISVRLVAGE
jgi:hypothetical protein